MRKLLVAVGILLLAGCAQQKTQEGFPVFQNMGNPLITDKFTADPAPMVYNDTLFLYVGHDEYYEGQDTASGGKEFNITEWLCYYDGYADMDRLWFGIETYRFQLGGR